MTTVLSRWTPRHKALALLFIALILIGFLIGGIGIKGVARQAVSGVEALAPSRVTGGFERSVDALRLAINPPAAGGEATAETAAPLVVEATSQPTAEPDILTQLRRRLTAVETLEGGEVVYLIERGNREGLRRPLKIGDEFEEGWQVVAITDTSVALSRDGETRVLRIYAIDDT